MPPGILIGDKKHRFSEKVVILKNYMYDGEHNGGQWRLVVRPYLISQAPEIEAILKFVESNDDTMASVSNLLAHKIIEDDETLILRHAGGPRRGCSHCGHLDSSPRNYC